MPGCDFTRRDLLRWTAVALASPLGLRVIGIDTHDKPGGFSLLRLHTDGYALNFYKTRSDFAREWSERSRQEISGAWPQFALGSSVSDRNTVGEHDLSALRPVRHPEALVARMF